MNPLNIDDDALNSFNNVKLNRKNRYMICSIDDAGSALKVEKMGEADAPYSEVAENLPKDDCRYAIVDMEYETDENPPRKTNKLVLFLWVPMATPAKRRFTFASSNDSLKKAFTGIQKEFQVF